MGKFKKVYYLETADGDVMRVPEKKLNYFRRLNEKIKAEQSKSGKGSQENSSSEDR